MVIIILSIGISSIFVSTYEFSYCFKDYIFFQAAKLSFSCEWAFIANITGERLIVLC